MKPEPVISKAEEELLRSIAGRIIPPSPDASLPGADDLLIFQQILGESAQQLQQLQNHLHDLLRVEGGTAEIAEWDEARREQCVSRWAEEDSVRSHAFFKLFQPQVIQAYYRDVRVQQAYNRRPGPPFPGGYERSEGDMSLLDQVRDRPPFYRT